MTAILNTTRIYVDADACPVKDEIYRVAILLRFSPHSTRPSAASSTSALGYQRKNRVELKFHGAAADPVERHRADLRRHPAIVGRRTVGVFSRARLFDRPQRLRQIDAVEDRRRPGRTR